MREAGTGNTARAGAMPLFDCMVFLKWQATILVPRQPFLSICMAHSGPTGNGPCLLPAGRLVPPYCKQRCQQQSLLQLPSGTVWHLPS